MNCSPRRSPRSTFSPAKRQDTKTNKPTDENTVVRHGPPKTPTARRPADDSRSAHADVNYGPGGGDCYFWTRKPHAAYIYYHRSVSYAARVYNIVECRESEIEEKKRRKKKTLVVLCFSRNVTNSDCVFGREPLSITRSLTGLIVS